jgi:hypothetical protein
MFCKKRTARPILYRGDKGKKIAIKQNVIIEKKKRKKEGQRTFKVVECKDKVWSLVFFSPQFKDTPLSSK